MTDYSLPDQPFSFPEPPEGYRWRTWVGIDALINIEAEGNHPTDSFTCQIGLAQFKANPQGEINAICEKLAERIAIEKQRREFNARIVEAASAANRKAAKR